MAWRIKAILTAAIAGVCVLGATAARATSFNTDWKTALKTPTATNCFAGAWEGKWKSTKHHVSGPLRCVITQLPNGDYQARFHAQFHWFHFTYTAKLVAQNTTTGTLLKGEADLGWMGGTYHYSGQVSPTKYFSTYASPVEDGVLELARPQKV